jgi:hypothetical protein
MRRCVGREGYLFRSSVFLHPSPARSLRTSSGVKRLAMGALVVIGAGIAPASHATDTSQHPIAIAMERESRMVAGRATFTISFNDAVMDELPTRSVQFGRIVMRRMTPPVLWPSLEKSTDETPADDTFLEQLFDRIAGELTSTAFLECVWRGQDVWRIDLLAEDGAVLRTIISDGSRIDTGDGTVWDARFLTDYRHAPEEFCHEFAALTLPYQFFAGLLFPLSEGGRTNFRWLNAWYDFVEREDSDSTDGSSPTVTFDYRHRAMDIVGYEPPGRILHQFPYLSVRLDTEHGHMPRRIAIMQGTAPIAYMDYGDPVMIDKDLWVPTAYRNMVAFGGPLEETASCSLLVERSQFTIAAVTGAFQLPQHADARVVRWPGDEEDPETLLAELQQAHEEAEQAKQRFIRQLAERPKALVMLRQVLPWVFMACGIVFVIAGLRFLIKRRQERRSAA